MSIFYDLGIDCGLSEDKAEQIYQYFEGLVLHIDAVQPVELSLEKKCQDELWFVSVHPVGMVQSTFHPVRPELLEEDNMKAVERELLKHLQNLDGYRRARFGAEVSDILWWAGSDEAGDIDYLGMVFQADLFQPLPSGLQTEPFTPGYERVVRTAE